MVSAAKQEQLQFDDSIIAKLCITCAPAGLAEPRADISSARAGPVIERGPVE